MSNMYNDMYFERQYEDFQDAFVKYVAQSDNHNKDGSINWDYVDADLCMDGFQERLGGQKEYLMCLNEAINDYMEAVA